MGHDLKDLRLEKLIVHEIPLRVGKDKPTFSEIESPADAVVRNFFEERLRVCLTESAYPAEFDVTSDSPVPGHLRHLLDVATSNFVSDSQAIGQRLFDVQTGVNSPGLLTVADCRIKGVPCVGVMKVEKEHGVRVQSQSINGRSTLSVQHIKDLMLTQKTRVFKIGLFIAVTQGDPEILICDQQRPFADAVASFFISRFLGCRLTADPHIQTRDFMDAVEDWINQDIEDPARKAKYHRALITELESNRQTLTPKKFAEDFLEVRDTKSFAAGLSLRGAPATRFHKDTKLVKNRLLRVRFDFNTDVAVLAPPSAIGESVRIEETEHGARLTVEGKLDGIHGRKR